MKTDLVDERIVNKILLVRGKKVILDKDLALLYKVETKVLNQAVKRNKERFPDDFMFQMDRLEFENWKSQFVTSNSYKMGLRKLPFVFTEQGVAMLSSVLNSKTAIQVNIQIMRVFTRLRESLITNKEILLKLEQLENKVGGNDKKINKHESEIQLIFKAIKQLIEKPEVPRRRIGYKSED